MSFSRNVRISAYFSFTSNRNPKKKYFCRIKCHSMGSKISTFGFVCANVVCCTAVVIFFGRNCVLRLAALGALYKEYLCGVIVLVLFYFNVFFLFPKLYLKGSSLAYLIAAFLCGVLAAIAELVFVNPQIAPLLNASFNTTAAQAIMRKYLFLISLRNLGIMMIGYTICEIRNQRNSREQHEIRLRDVVQEIDALSVDNNNNFIKVSNILYCQQARNTTWIYHAGGNIFLRYGSLKKTAELIGADRMIQVSKDLMVNREMIDSYAEDEVVIKDPILQKKIPLSCSSTYFKQNGEKTQTLWQQESLQLANICDTEDNSTCENIHSNRKKIMSLIKQNQYVRPIHSFIRKHPGCKTSDIAAKVKISQSTVNRILKQLKDEGLIEYTGSKKTGGYRLKVSV